VAVDGQAEKVLLLEKHTYIGVEIRLMRESYS
jgi:hypothetical protein